MLSKKEIRLLVSERRKSLEKQEKDKFDEIIASKVLDSEFFKSAETVFVYVSYENEVDTHFIINKALSHKKTVCVPKIISKEQGMDAVKILSFDELKVSKYGILEPELTGNNLVSPGDIDLLIMPGVAFDLRGGRVGYGGAFYDRFLEKTKEKAIKAAIAYSFQIFDEVPMDGNDKKVDFIITEKDLEIGSITY